jgi:hypothetical protein
VYYFAAVFIVAASKEEFVLFVGAKSLAIATKSLVMKQLWEHRLVLASCKVIVVVHSTKQVVGHFLGFFTSIQKKETNHLLLVSKSKSYC